eukprot:6928931-Prymnesium_polylepis.1
MEPWRAPGHDRIKWSCTGRVIMSGSRDDGDAWARMGRGPEPAALCWLTAPCRRMSLGRGFAG